MTATADGPLRRVLAAFTAGAGSLDEVAHQSGLDRELVDAAVDQLVRLGRLSAKELSVGCPDSGCGGCASGHGDQPGCGAPGPSSARSGPVLIALSVLPFGASRG
jgi:FeoC like transcriptional regulator